LTTISFIGAGNVAWHLAIGLKNCGFRIGSIWSRNQKNSQELASKVEAKVALTVNCFDDASEMIIISVRDEALPGIANELMPGNRLVIHTSGAIGLNIFNMSTPRRGVLYPFQTFSKFVNLDLKKTPFFIEASTPSDLEEIHIVANRLSGKVLVADESTRKLIHIAGVFACNFSNYLYTIAYNLLQSEGLSFDILKPIIEETTRKAIENIPVEVQTGPASRGDTSIIKEHLNLLERFPEYQRLYKILSDKILEEFKHKQN
jgi:predicted short-subunit dehydrogenase-like oxidoreductase (DUF2520 family)